jgi:hypothetical protein
LDLLQSNSESLEKKKKGRKNKKETENNKKKKKKKKKKIEKKKDENNETNLAFFSQPSTHTNSRTNGIEFLTIYPIDD